MINFQRLGIFIWRYVSISGGVLSLFVKFSRKEARKIKFVKFHVGKKLSDKNDPLLENFSP